MHVDAIRKETNCGNAEDGGSTAEVEKPEDGAFKWTTSKGKELFIPVGESLAKKNTKRPLEAHGGTSGIELSGDESPLPQLPQLPAARLVTSQNREAPHHSPGPSSDPATQHVAHDRLVERVSQALGSTGMEQQKGDLDMEDGLQQEEGSEDEPFEDALPLVLMQSAKKQSLAKRPKVDTSTGLNMAADPC
ncbi:hypothetical protein J5N97_015041 [Dioscorea zingiberensis]|uniref:Uncharacterized protein n=1 Tax=Dioscorea zingiberensis TaxID=325984 RepID=A0A9D5CV23_9LILI|nr:hypothetical protein J5N97_015041 [Dioscorea zingiberensis]